MKNFGIVEISQCQVRYRLYAVPTARLQTLHSVNLVLLMAHPPQPTQFGTPYRKQTFIGTNSKQLQSDLESGAFSEIKGLRYAKSNRYYCQLTARPTLRCPQTCHFGNCGGLHIE